MWDYIYYLDLAGTFAFAVSGALSGIEKRYDMFGVLFVGFITAVGGGTTRDLLLGATPVSWMKNITYLYVILHKEIYATACFAGGLLIFGLSRAGVASTVNVPAAIGAIILIRILAVRFKWSLPVLGRRQKP